MLLGGGCHVKYDICLQEGNRCFRDLRDLPVVVVLWSGLYVFTILYAPHVWLACLAYFSLCLSCLTWLACLPRRLAASHVVHTQNTQTVHNALHMWVFVAQPVEHCSANAEAMGSNPAEALKIFFNGDDCILISFVFPQFTVHFILCFILFAG